MTTTKTQLIGRFQLLSTTTPQVAQSDNNKKTQLIGGFRLLSTTTPQVAQSDNNKKRNSLVGFSSSRPQRHKSHISTSGKKNATHFVGSDREHSVTISHPRVTELGKLHPFVGTQHPNRSSGPAKSRYFRVCIICRLGAKTVPTVCGVDHWEMWKICRSGSI